MANTVTNFLEVVGTEEVKAAMDELFNNAGGYADTTQFVNTFYGTEFEGGVSHDWLFENVGAKWIYVENEIGEGEWNISSAGYTPDRFWIHLYKKAAEIDPNVEIVVKFQDESYEPIGAFVVKKDYQGNSGWSMEELYDVENPTEDMDWDDEGYDDAQMKFQEDLDDMLTDLANTAHDNVWSIEGKKLDEK